MTEYTYAHNCGRLMGAAFNVLNAAAHNPSRLSEALGNLEGIYNEIDRELGMKGLSFTLNPPRDTSVGMRSEDVS